MSSPGPDSLAFQKILAEHEELKQLLDKIDRALSNKTASIDDVSQLLGQLGDRLVRHFALEEEGGYFAEALRHAPQLISKANELLAQHPKMCTQACSFVADIQTPRTIGDDWWQRTKTRFDAFRSELLRHERQENGLIQEAYARDIGTSD